MSSSSGSAAAADSESDSAREEEEEEGEEGAQRSSEEAEEEEGEEGEGEEEGENGHASKQQQQQRRQLEGPSSGAGSAARRNSSSGSAVVNARSCKSVSLSTLAFPISRVRRLVKSEVDVQWVGVEAGFLIAKAAELFLEKLVEDAFDKMTDEERSTLSYKDLASHVSGADRLDFLSDFVPELVPASTALLVKAQADR